MNILKCKQTSTDINSMIIKFMQIILTCLFILQNIFKSKQTSTDINFMIIFIMFMYKLYDRANQNDFKMFQNVLKRKQTSTH